MTKQHHYSQYEAIIFDWDGTIADSISLIATSIQKAFEVNNLPIPSFADSKAVIGLGLDDAITRLIPSEISLNQELVQNLSNSYRTFYFAKSKETVLLEGAFEFIQKLLVHQTNQTNQNNDKNVPYLAISTGKGRPGLNESLEISQLKSAFSVTKCASESQSKPNPAMLFEIANELGINIKNCLMIGDTEHDLQMAINAGCDALAIASGTQPIERLAQFQPIKICHDWQDITEYLGV